MPGHDVSFKPKEERAEKDTREGVVEEDIFEDALDQVDWYPERGVGADSQGFEFSEVQRVFFGLGSAASNWGSSSLISATAGYLMGLLPFGAGLSMLFQLVQRIMASKGVTFFSGLIQTLALLPYQLLLPDALQQEIARVTRQYILDYLGDIGPWLFSVDKNEQSDYSQWYLWLGVITLAAHYLYFAKKRIPAPQSRIGKAVVGMVSVLRYAVQVQAFIQRLLDFSPMSQREALKQWGKHFRDADPDTRRRMESLKAEYERQGKHATLNDFFAALNEFTRANASEANNGSVEDARTAFAPSASPASRGQSLWYAISDIAADLYSRLPSLPDFPRMGVYTGPVPDYLAEHVTAPAEIPNRLNEQPVLDFSSAPTGQQTSGYTAPETVHVNSETDLHTVAEDGTLKRDPGAETVSVIKALNEFVNPDAPGTHAFARSPGQGSQPLLPLVATGAALHAANRGDMPGALQGLLALEAVGTSAWMMYKLWSSQGGEQIPPEGVDQPVVETLSPVEQEILNVLDHPFDDADDKTFAQVIEEKIAQLPPEPTNEQLSSLVDEVAHLARKRDISNGVETFNEEISAIRQRENSGLNEEPHASGLHRVKRDVQEPPLSAEELENARAMLGAQLHRMKRSTFALRFLAEDDGLKSKAATAKPAPEKVTTAKPHRTTTTTSSPPTSASTPATVPSKASPISSETLAKLTPATPATTMYALWKDVGTIRFLADLPPGNDALVIIERASDEPKDYIRIALPPNTSTYTTEIAREFTKRFESLGMVAGQRYEDGSLQHSTDLQGNHFYVTPGSGVTRIFVTIVPAQVATTKSPVTTTQASISPTPAAKTEVTTASVSQAQTAQQPPARDPISAPTPAETEILAEQILPGAQKYLEALKRLDGKFESPREYMERKLSTFADEKIKNPTLLAAIKKDLLNYRVSVTFRDTNPQYGMAPIGAPGLKFVPLRSQQPQRRVYSMFDIMSHKMTADRLEFRVRGYETTEYRHAGRQSAEFTALVNALAEVDWQPTYLNSLDLRMQSAAIREDAEFVLQARVIGLTKGDLKTSSLVSWGRHKLVGVIMTKEENGNMVFRSLNSGKEWRFGNYEQARNHAVAPDSEFFKWLNAYRHVYDQDDPDFKYYDHFKFDLFFDPDQESFKFNIGEQLYKDITAKFRSDGDALIKSGLEIGTGIGIEALKIVDVVAGVVVGAFTGGSAAALFLGILMNSALDFESALIADTKKESVAHYLQGAYGAAAGLGAGAFARVKAIVGKAVEVLRTGGTEATDLLRKLGISTGAAQAILRFGREKILDKSVSIARNAVGDAAQANKLIAGGVCWDFVINVQRKGGLLSKLEAQALQTSTRSTRFASYLGEHAFVITSKEQMQSVRKGSRLAFIEQDAGGESMKHAMISAGGGRAIGMKNDWLNPHYGPGAKEINLADTLDWRSDGPYLGAGSRKIIVKAQAGD